MSRSEYVYLVGVAADGSYKIGWSHTPQRRLYHLRLAEKNPALMVLHQIASADAFWLEQYLHVTFRHRRVKHPVQPGRFRREWFQLTDEEVSVFKSLVAADTPTDLPATVIGLFNWNDVSPRCIETGRLNRMLKKETEKAAEALPRLMEQARRKRTSLARVLRKWIARSLASEEKTVLRQVAENIREAIILAEVDARDFSCPYIRQGFLDKARDLRKQHAELERAIAELAKADVRNVTIMEYQFPEHWVPLLGSRIKNIHFKEWTKKGTDHSLESFRPLLDGTTNWPAVMEALDKVGYRGYLTFEYFHPFPHYPEALIYQSSDALDRMLGRKG
jgi:hypothetical protein